VRIRAWRERASGRRGFALIALLALAALISAFLIASALNLTSAGNSNEREDRSMSALRKAKAALIAYAANEQWQLYKTPGTYFQPGALPCPDQDDDGDADCIGSTSFSMIGRVPFKTLGIDETISSTRVLMNVIEQELPSGGFMPLMSLAGSANELIEAEIAIGTPPAGKSVGSLRLPSGALVGGIIRKGKLMHADDETKLEVGDRVMVFSPTASESEVRKALFG